MDKTKMSSKEIPQYETDCGVMRRALAELVATGLWQECTWNDGNKYPYAAIIVQTLLRIASTPDEYTEDASVNAARLLWEV